MTSDFIGRIKEEIPRVGVMGKEESALHYGDDTGASERLPSGAVVVTHIEDVEAIIRLANECKVSLWPISGGRNFGYGTSLPVSNESYILDLTRLKKVNIDVESSTAVIEPGVTQIDLLEAIKESGARLLVPTTGVGPNGNILGNALDGGYGLTPITDHFESLTEIEGYWGNGVAFSHTYQDMKCPEMAKRWQQGTGYSWHGLLRQSNFGIVTRARVQLARAPESTRILILEWQSNEDFYGSQEELNKLSEDIPGIGGVIMMNASRILSTQKDTPLASSLKGEAREAYLARLAKERRVSTWTGMATLYGSKNAVAGAVKDIKRRLKKCTVWSFTPRQIKALKVVEGALPKVGFPALRRHFGSLVNALGTVEGYPIVAFLKIAYGLEPTAKSPDEKSHPAKDGVGLLWYAPLLPFTENDVKLYNDIMSQCLIDHGFDPLLAVTSRSSRTLSATIPLLFDKKSPDDVERAKKCYRALVQVGLDNGWPPYRLGIDYMDMFSCGADTNSAKVHMMFKMALDENGVIAPGRYEHVQPNDSLVDCKSNLAS